MCLYHGLISICSFKKELFQYFKLLHLWVYSMMDFGIKIIAHSKWNVLLVIKVLVNFFMKVTLILRKATTNLLCVGNAHRESVWTAKVHWPVTWLVVMSSIQHPNSKNCYKWNICLALNNMYLDSAWNL